MPNRVIRESARWSKKLDSVSGNAERLYWRLQTVADDHGRFRAEPIVLLSECFPLRVKSYTVPQVSGWSDELVTAGLVVPYLINGDLYGYFTNWEQRKRASRSRFPDPPPDAASRCQLAADDGLGLGLGFGNGNGDPPLPPLGGVRRRRKPARQEPEAFSLFWQSYPRKVKRAKALEAWAKLSPDADLVARIMRAVEAQARSADWRKEGGRYIPHPASWLNGQRWEDEPMRRVSGPDELEGL